MLRDHFILSWTTLLLVAAPLLAQFTDTAADREALPKVKPGFEMKVFAREPLVRHPCSMAFDAKGRLFVGMGPQWRNPKPQTPGDSVVIVLDTDGDGQADKTKVFATGFNCVQSLAWRGRDLWVANAPDLTIVRDLDGDDEADEYVQVYTDLGNLEHGLHGLNWGPDGKLYMSKGNSKGLTKPGRVAPKAFRELWGVTAPAGSPDLPEPRIFRKGEYQRAYHDPADDWGREGGVLRCDEGGRNLEIISRGFRNPWDITPDSGFNLLGTDNDQTAGDRIFMPFLGAHFGWNHAWSSHWSDAPHLPTAPSSGPMFEGSGTGLVFCNSPQFPAEYRGVFLINDWLRKMTFVWRPVWDGALMRPRGGNWEPFVEGGKALYRPTDIEVGPDGALWILGWGGGYGAELDKDGKMTDAGRVFRVTWKDAPPSIWRHSKRDKPLRAWSVAELLVDFDQPVPACRIDAQDELVRRGAAVKAELLANLMGGKLSEAQETWTAWALGRMAPADAEITAHFAGMLAADSRASLNLRIQSVRILAHRGREAGRNAAPHAAAAAQLRSSEPRLRLAAVEALAIAEQKQGVNELVSLLAEEADRVVAYAAWQTLRGLSTPEELRALLADRRGGVRRGALLALLESNLATTADLSQLAGDADAGVRELLALRSGKSVANRPPTSAITNPVASPATGPALVRNIKARSGRNYQYISAGLAPGARNFIDRNYELKQVPAALTGADFLQTSNDDDGSSGRDFLTFDAIVPVRVHVAFDGRMTQAPTWAREGFKHSELKIQADHWTFHLYSRDFPAGKVELGGNTDDGKAGGKSHYIVVIEPLPLAPQSSLVTMPQAMTQLEKGDAARGEILFKHRGGAGCAKCHSLGERKNSFGPELSNIGHRAAAKHIVQSIVEPNAVITPGFSLHFIETDDGETHAGVLLEESGLSVTLGLPTAESRVIDKKKIASRRTASTSAMPALTNVLTAQQVADIAAFLLTQKGAPGAAPANTSPAPSASNPASPPTTTPSSQPAPPSRATAPEPVAAVSVESGDWRLATEPGQHQAVVSLCGKPVAAYVWQDRDTLRPYFKSVKAPSGVQITRPHPATGEGADHATMHPGIWFGFGAINGVDFWRNKGRVVQERFTPIAEKGKPLGFDVINRYEEPEGGIVCRQEVRYRFVNDADGYVMLIDSRFTADEALTFGVQEEMGLGVRVPTAMTVKNGGAILSSTGGQNEKGTWGKVADWWDYHGKLENKAVGMMVMSAAGNGEVWSHSRDYGVLVANPVRGKPVVVKAGASWRLIYGVRIHEHDAEGRFDRAATYQRFLALAKDQEAAKP